MANRQEFAHGQFSWVDLAAHDTAGIRGFYESLFGWTTVDLETQGGPPYAQFHLNGRAVAGLGQMPEELQAQGMPPIWNSYINVDDAEAVVKKTTELGGQVTMPVMQILDFGWMTFIQDPSGGHVGIWQKNTHAGAEVVNSPGSFCWHELATRDSEAAKIFFANLLGWEYEDNPAAPTPYAIIKNLGQQNGGIMQMDEQWGEVPPHWMVYFSVDDIDQSVNKLQELGGTVCVPAFEIPVGRISVVGDPQGGTFTMIQLNEIAN